MAIHDCYAGQTFVSFQPGQVILVCADRQDQCAGRVCHYFGPVILTRLMHWSAHDLEILGATGIGQDKPDIAAFFQAVFYSFLACCNDLRRGSGIVGRNEKELRSLMIMNIDDNVVIEPCTTDAHEEPRISFFIDQFVF